MDFFSFSSDLRSLRIAVIFFCSALGIGVLSGDIISVVVVSSRLGEDQVVANDDVSRSSTDAGDNQLGSIMSLRQLRGRGGADDEGIDGGDGDNVDVGDDDCEEGKYDYDDDGEENDNDVGDVVTT